jgi:hypothetical protein
VSITKAIERGPSPGKSRSRCTKEERMHKSDARRRVPVKRRIGKQTCANKKASFKIPEDMKPWVSTAS